MCLFTNQENRDHDNNGIGDENVDYYDDYDMTTGPGQENRDDPLDNDDDHVTLPELEHSRGEQMTARLH